MSRAGGLKEVADANWALWQALPGAIDVTFLGAASGGCRPATRRTLLDSMHDTWDAVLFVCHGNADGLLLDAEGPGEPDWIGAAELVEVFRSAGTQLAMFDACSSAAIAAAVARVVPVVVAMQLPVTLAAAATFWRAFFHAFSSAVPVDLAVLEGRQWLESLAAHLPDWGTPIVWRGQPAVVPDSTPEVRSTRMRGGRAELQGAARHVTDDIRAVGLSLAAMTVQALGPASIAEASADEDPPLTPEWICARRIEDPWHLLLMGDRGTVALTQPLWRTALRAAPRLLVWPPHARAISYRVELDDGEADVPVVFDAPRNALVLAEASERLAAAADESPNWRWTVTALLGDGRRAMHMRGLFRVLSAAERDALAVREAHIAERTVGLARSVALADLWIGAELYDQAFRFLHARALASGNGADGYVLRRLLGFLFKRMHDQMNYTDRWIGPEVGMSGSESERQMRLAYCCALGRLQQCARRGRASAAAPCAHCGLG